MEIEVYWTAFAVSKLHEIHAYYRKKAGQKIAIKISGGIVRATLALHYNPYVGQEESLLANRPQGFRFLVHANYKIVYWFKQSSNRVEVVHVLTPVGIHGAYKTSNPEVS